MCQCHTMWQSEGDMQVQVAHSKKSPLGEKKSYMGWHLFFRGYPRRGGGTKKNPREFFSTPYAHPGIGVCVPYMWRTRLHIYIYAHTCPCVRVNTVTRPFLRERGLGFPSQILSPRVHNTLTVSTISRPCLLEVRSVYSVYRLYPGKHACVESLQTMHMVDMYAQCRRTTHTRACTRTHVYATGGMSPRFYTRPPPVQVG